MQRYLRQYSTVSRQAMTLDTLLCTFALPPRALEKINQSFKTVHYYPDNTTSIPKAALESAELLFTAGSGLHRSISSFDQLPRLKHVQTNTAGVNAILHSGPFEALTQKGKPHVTLASASGTHALCIPNYVVASMISLFHQLHVQWIHARNKANWASAQELDISGQGLYSRKTVGRTVGLLGYGALGRETARLCKALGMRVVAANTSGKKTADRGYVLPNMGDPAGALACRSASPQATIADFRRHSRAILLHYE